MRPIPSKLRSELAKDPFYKECCITGETAGKIDWHHNLIYGSKQVNERWCILPLVRWIHDKEKQPRFKELLNWIMLNRATDADLDRYSKVINYKRLKESLNKKYGVYRESDPKNYLGLVSL